MQDFINCYVPQEPRTLQASITLHTNTHTQEKVDKIKLLSKTNSFCKEKNKKNVPIKLIRITIEKEIFTFKKTSIFHTR